jgi:hypothetical protein
MRQVFFFISQFGFTRAVSVAPEVLKKHHEAAAGCRVLCYVEPRSPMVSLSIGPHSHAPLAITVYRGAERLHIDPNCFRETLKLVSAMVHPKSSLRS